MLTFLRFNKKDDESIAYLREEQIEFDLKECDGDERAAQYSKSLCGETRNLLYVSENRVLLSPTPADIAKFVLQKDIEGERANYDLLIVGAGPAGMTTAIYAARGNLTVLMLEQMVIGGLMTKTDEIENYPGFEEPIGGYELAIRMKNQAERFGAQLFSGGADSVSLTHPIKIVQSGKREFFAYSVLVSVGTEPRKIGVPGEDEYYSRGVSYCATCDGPLYRDRNIAVVGGGDSALQEALFLAKFGKTVTIIHRRNEFRGEKLLQERVLAKSNIRFELNCTVEELIGNGDGIVAVKLHDKTTGKSKKLDCLGVFIFIGLLPKTAIKGFEVLKTDEQGFILTDTHTCTNVPGVFAAGDVRSGNFRQVATAVGDGAIASHAAEAYISSLVLPAFPY